MRAVWLNGALVEPSDAAVSIDSVAVRFGEGLFETMRGVGATVPRLADHLARMCRSADALGIPIAPRAELETAVATAVNACPAPHQRVRLTAAPGLVLAEATKATSIAGGPGAAVAVVVPSTWFPGRAIAEHKTLSYGGYRYAARRAEAAGAAVALLADQAGRLGEADIGNLFAAIDGELMTPPVEGLLPGIARATLLAGGLARESHLTPEAMAAATELFMTNSVRGVTALTDTAGARWARDAPGPKAREAHRELAQVN